jgi:hypothetical protein
MLQNFSRIYEYFASIGHDLGNNSVSIPPMTDYVTVLYGSMVFIILVVIGFVSTRQLLRKALFLDHMLVQ